MTEPFREQPADPGLYKVTVNLIPAAMDALNQASGILDEDRTTVINRALQVYAMLMRERNLGWELVLTRENLARAVSFE